MATFNLKTLQCMIDFIGIELITFHDATIHELCIEKTPIHALHLAIEVWDDLCNDYNTHKLLFEDLQRINPTDLTIQASEDVTIHTFDYYLKDGLFFGKMICLKDGGTSAINIDFSCKMVTVDAL